MLSGCNFYVVPLFRAGNCFLLSTRQ